MKLLNAFKTCQNYSSNHTGSFSLSLADSSLDCAGVWMGVWTGVFGVECPLVASSAIAFFCFFFFFYTHKTKVESVLKTKGQSMTLSTQGHGLKLCLFSIVSITFPPL